MDPLEIGRSFALYFLPFLFALCFHEFAHGWVARLKGDRTAEIMGRLTLNPIAHMDFVGTFLLPMAAILTHIPFFGWAKPVPVDARNLKNPRVDMFWIALAGPLSNLLLAVVGALLMSVILVIVPREEAHVLLMILAAFVQVNLFLAFFNLIPLHPLDGGKVLARFIPARWNYFLEQHQNYMNIALILLFVTGGFRIVAEPALLSADFLFNSAQHLANAII